jgi:hypothetical protein
VPTYLMRVWVPDRPGALGGVASRIGAVRGDLVGIDILERGAGRAIDELVIELPDAALLDLLVAEVSQVDGVDVEHVRPLGESVPDPRVDALETAAVIIDQDTVEGLYTALVDNAQRDFDADWAAIVDLPSTQLVASAGESPDPAWLSAFVAGTRASAWLSTGRHGPDDIASAHIPASDAALVLGRRNRPFRERERQQLLAICRIADRRWPELAIHRSRNAHPSAC